ncbi:hypothetical protein KOR42_00250 [Thalassoglobus neptunius]|uniref:SMP-30/Gluconolaconase/LRE-like region n=1 Tax=Thalassoglobus neptunius TaxID=1938619 RepID=A0A5C5X3B5_9PLAN|nr:hypothetical protein [Thalassoglobus neptunius]TWT56672.1 hypothetical protein KOR42_00250 [Thalassoglobus neptunius]
MLRSIQPICGIVLGILLSQSLVVSAEIELQESWSITGDELDHPESIYLDRKSGFLFLSQIGGGGGAAKDGDGWITKLTLDGKIVSHKWVTGLNAPKGIRSHENTLYVSDIDRVVAIDIEAGEIVKEYLIPEAKFLNDLCTSDDGTIYVSDMVASRIYQIKDNKASVFLEGPELEHPNGVLVEGNSLIIGGWGTGFNTEDFSTEALGRLKRVNRDTKEITVITAEPTGHLDGIESDGRGGYFVTDWRIGKLFHVTGDGSVTLVKEYPQGVADLAVIAEQNLIVIPEMLEGKLTAHKFEIAE